MAAINISAIKTKIRDTLLAYKTTTLATGLSKAIKTIEAVNPYKLVATAEKFPFITVFYEGKTTEPKDIGNGSARAKRRADLEFKIVAGYWNDSYNKSYDDPADEDIEKMMENIEVVLREDATLGATVHWSYPTGIEMYDKAGEKTHLRFGIMSYKAIVFY